MLLHPPSVEIHAIFSPTSPALAAPIFLPKPSSQPTSLPSPSFLLRRMSPRPLRRIIYAHKRPVDFIQALQTILQRLSDVVRVLKGRLFVEQDVDFDPDAFAGVVGCHGSISLVSLGREWRGMGGRDLWCNEEVRRGWESGAR